MRKAFGWISLVIVSLLLLIGVFPASVTWVYDHVYGPKRVQVTPYPRIAVFDPELEDIEPDSIQVYHCNRAFLGSRVTLTTAAGKHTSSFPWSPSVHDQSITFANPGHMREGWTLIIKPWYRDPIIFRSKRTGDEDLLHISLLIRDPTHTPALCLADVPDVDRSSLALYPE